MRTVAVLPTAVRTSGRRSGLDEPVHRSRVACSDTAARAEGEHCSLATFQYPVRSLRTLGIASGALAAGWLAVRLFVTGALTLDVGIGRRVRPLGPLDVDIAAHREVVFSVIAGPYLERTPRAISGEIEVLERGSDMVLAAHRTPVRRRLVATTVETVRFTRPETVDFRLVRGPVPHVLERFTLRDEGERTRLEYSGELGTDWWRAGRWWGNGVARRWEQTVRASLERIRGEA